MKKNLSYRLNSKNVATTKNDEYTALMLYDIAQKLIVFLEVFLPQYHKSSYYSSSILRKTYKKSVRGRKISEYIYQHNY